MSYVMANALGWYIGVYDNLQSELLEVVDLCDPDGTPMSERRQLRNADEIDHFSAEHYL